MRILLRSPLLHFLLLGGLIFALVLWRSHRDLESITAMDPASLAITIDSEKINELRTSYQRQMGRAPSARELDTMVSAEVDEEILYRDALALGFIEKDGGIQTRLVQKMLFLDSGAKLEDARDLLARALSLGLDRDDVVVRRILVQKMRLHASQLASDEEPSDEDIAEAYADRLEDLREPDRRDLIHVFLSADRRQAQTLDDARALRKQILDEGISASEAIALGDPFPLGHRLEARSRLDLRRRFGLDFGKNVFATPPKTWSPPIASVYGQHLVWTSKLRPGTIPPLEAVEDRIRGKLVRERRARKLQAMLTRERSRYTIVIDRTGEQE